MNSLFIQWGIEGYKPFLTALLLPPVPFLLMTLFGLGLVRTQKRGGTTLIATALAGVRLGSSLGVAQEIAPQLLALAPPLDAAAIEVMHRQARERVAIIVLGSGVEQWAPEYRGSSLSYRSLERLRYGIWLGRQTGWPVGFSGGLGWGQTTAHTAREADVAQRIATEEFARPLRWVENTSRDTRENARNVATLLEPQEIRRIVLVTHANHMPRAIRNFERAVATSVHVEAAPIGLAREVEWPVLRWMPTGEGAMEMRSVLREWMGMISGA